MDFVHFLKSQRYRTRVPLRQLRFTVAVYRAIVVEEANVELLAEVTVPWDGKVFSPQETLSLYQDLARLTRGPAAHGGGLRTHPSGATTTGGAGHTPASPLPSPAPAAAAALGLGPSSPAASTTGQRKTGASSVLHLPHVEEVVAQLQLPTSQFFTRPTAEDFIDCAEEDFPVDPPQGPSRLAPVILRQHRRDHQPNRKMFLLWATGTVHATESSPAVHVRAPAPASAVPSSSPAADPFAAPTGAAPLEADAVTWRGEERVFCTLTAEQDEHVFTARPSLNEVHTLYIDAAHIYSFRVTVSNSAAGAPGNKNGEESVAYGTLDPTASPLDLVLANVREVAQCVEEVYEQLEVGRDAVARRLLRQAAMMVPAERGGRTPSSSGSAAAAASSSLLDESGRTRSGLLGFRMPSPSAAGATTAAFVPERSMSVAFSAMGMPLAQARGAAGVGGAVLGRTAGTMRGVGHALPQGMCQYFVCGTVERCVGIAESTLFLRCHIMEDDAATSWLYDKLASSSPSAICSFTSQLAHISAFIADESLMDVDHVFNLPFDHTFVGPKVAGSPLRLVVVVYTAGAAGEGLQSAVAYACVTLPTASPGCHSLSAAMWAPHKTGVEFLRSTFVGGAPSLVDARQTGPPPSNRTGISVKEGLYADSVGRVLLTVNVLQHRGQDNM